MSFTESKHIEQIIGFLRGIRRYPYKTRLRIPLFLLRCADVGSFFCRLVPSEIGSRAQFRLSLRAGFFHRTGASNCII